MKRKGCFPFFFIIKFFFHIYSANINEKENQQRSSVTAALTTLEEKMDITIALNKIKEKDEITYDHSLNAGKLCYDFCLYLGKSESHASEMKVAGYLHDAGKLDIPDEVLNKPGVLTDKEFETMKSHTLYAEAHLKKSSNIARIVAWGHHLSYSGGGYPNVSLSGKDIPEECRIAAICDVYDALTSKRQYKDGMGSNKALELMKDFKQLDPYLFKEFKTMMEEREDV